MHGAALHAAFFDWLRTLDPAFATALHDDSGIKPFTVSMLHSGIGELSTPPLATETMILSPDTPYWFRITALEPTLAALLSRLAAKPPPHVKILGQLLTVVGMTVSTEQHRWARVSSDADLVAQAVYSPAPERNPKIRLRFASPTTFRANGRSQPVPLPELVWGSLAARWNMFSSLPIPPDFGAFVRENVLISAYDIGTEMVAMEGARREAKWVCFRGWCEFSVFSDDVPMIGWVRTLADYAFYAGVGYKTTMGFGQVSPSAPVIQR